MNSSESDAQNRETSESDSSDIYLKNKTLSESLGTILNTLSEDELMRYEKFRRVGFKRNMIKRMCLEVIGQSCNPKFYNCCLRIR